MPSFRKLDLIKLDQKTTARTKRSWFLSFFLTPRNYKNAKTVFHGFQPFARSKSNIPCEEWHCLRWILHFQDCERVRSVHSRSRDMKHNDTPSSFRKKGERCWRVIPGKLNLSLAISQRCNSNAIFFIKWHNAARESPAAATQDFGSSRIGIILVMIGNLQPAHQLREFYWLTQFENTGAPLFGKSSVMANLSFSDIEVIGSKVDFENT